MPSSNTTTRPTAKGFDRETAAQCLAAIYGDQSGFLSVASIRRRTADEIAANPKAKPVFSYQFFPYPAQTDAALAWLADEDAAGRDVYQGAHLLTARQRLKEYAAPIRALWADIDHDQIPAGTPQPSIIVESSHGRWQAYWRLSTTIEPAIAEALNKRLARATGADKSGYDLTQLLRVPGTWNYKREQTESVRLIRLGTETYDPADLDRILPPLPDEQHKKQATGTKAGDSIEPPVRLGEDALDRWAGRTYATDKDGALDRSKSLVAIARDLARAGATERTIIEAINERDATLGWHKYTSRPDAVTRYEEIAHRAIADTATSSNGTGPTDSATNGREFSLRDLMRMEIAPVPFVIQDILTAGTFVLSGKPKLGKSWLALDVAYAVANGRDVLGRSVAMQGDVLLLSLEDSPARLRARYTKLVFSDVPPASGSGGDRIIDFSLLDRVPEALDMRTDCPSLDTDPSKGLLGTIEEWRARHPNARLVIIDVLQRIKPSSQKGKNSYEQDYEAVAAIQSYMSKHGLACIIVHHNRKMESSDPLDLVSGTLGLVGGVDGLWILRRVRGQADAAMYVTGRDIEDDRDLALRFDRTTARWELLGDAEEVSRSREQKEIIDLLRESRDDDGKSKPLTPSAIAQLLDLKQTTVKARLRTAVKQGTVKADEKGRYSLIQCDPTKAGKDTNDADETD